MIILPTKRRLEKRRNALYEHLISVIQHASVQQVEDIMRQIHGINIKVRNYFQREQKHEIKELYEDD